MLVGDAGYAPSLASGQGTTLAMVGAYVLAGELKAAGGDHALAFPRYEQRMRDFVEKNQKLGRDGIKAMVLRAQWQILVDDAPSANAALHALEGAHQPSPQAGGRPGGVVDRARGVLSRQRLHR